MFKTYERPGVNSLCDRFLRLEEKWCKAFHVNAATSGNLDTVTDLDVLLDDLIHEKDDWFEEKRAEKNKLNDREKALVTAREEIRNQALTGKRRVNDEDVSAKKKKTQKKQTRRSSNALKNVRACTVDTAERQMVMDEKHMAIEERRLDFVIEMAEKQDMRFVRHQEVAERRQALDKRRFELEKAEREEHMREDREERREGREERKAIVLLIQKLVEK